MALLVNMSFTAIIIMLAKVLSQTVNIMWMPVLQRLDSAKSYNVFIKMCNKEQFCSAGGEPYVVEELPGGLRK